ncbi:MAG: hypothetical protein RIQ33_1279 [Bacteroidota bacterium]|jgi:four helix bundle protein
MTTSELNTRLKKFALRFFPLVESLPKTIAGRAVGNQVFRSGTSSAANYRAACRAKSQADFINKLRIVEEELDETLFWLELLEESKTLPNSKLTLLKTETEELLKIIAASGKTARQNKK